MLSLLYGSFLGLSVALLVPAIKKNISPETISQLWVFWLFAIFFIAISFVGIEVSLFAFMLFTAVFYIYDATVLKKKTKKGEKNLNYHLVDFFPILLIIWLIRSFLFQPYHVPTGSLEPTVRPGDFLLVNQYEYGIRMPIWRKLLYPVADPKRGDIVVFFPPGGNTHYVKRLVGLPGDVIEYRQKQLFINNKKMAQTAVGIGYAQDPGAQVLEQSEMLGNVEHKIFLNPAQPAAVSHTWIVPKNHYFMMGDNRDFSGDSRVFGFVPAANIVGQPMFIWLSFDAKAWARHDWLHLIRWQRIGQKVA